MGVLWRFKFNRATIRFSDVRGNYDAQLFVVGLMWHNRDKYSTNSLLYSSPPTIVIGSRISGFYPRS